MAMREKNVCSPEEDLLLLPLRRGWEELRLHDTGNIVGLCSVLLKKALKTQRPKYSAYSADPREPNSGYLPLPDFLASFWPRHLVCGGVHKWKDLGLTDQAQHRPALCSIIRAAMCAMGGGDLLDVEPTPENEAMLQLDNWLESELTMASIPSSLPPSSQPAQKPSESEQPVPGDVSSTQQGPLHPSSAIQPRFSSELATFCSQSPSSTGALSGRRQPCEPSRRSIGHQNVHSSHYRKPRTRCEPQLHQCPTAQGLLFVWDADGPKAVSC